MEDRRAGVNRGPGRREAYQTVTKKFIALLITWHDLSYNGQRLGTAEPAGAILAGAGSCQGAS